MTTNNSKSFSVQIVGENTGQVYSGEFTVIKFLSNRQHFLQDQLYRRYLGGDPTFADVESQARAKMMSEINAYCSALPDFWIKADAGIDIVDDNVLFGVYEKLKEAFKEIAAEREEKVKAAATALKAAADKLMKE
jgi:hypothetical protein